MQGVTVHCVSRDCDILKVETQSAGRQQHVALVISPSIAEDRYGTRWLHSISLPLLSHETFFPILLGNIRPSITPPGSVVQFPDDTEPPELTH